MASRIKNPYYSIEKFKWVYDKEDHRRYLELVPSKDNTLWADGIYPTKIYAEDLPEWYLYGRYWKKWGYISTKGVKDLYYKPNMWVNHMFKDDFLYISYDKPITKEDVENYRVEYYIWGWEIRDFLLMAEKYSGYDISKIKEQIAEKRAVYKERHPEDYKREVGDRDIWDKNF